MALDLWMFGGLIGLSEPGLAAQIILTIRKDDAVITRVRVKKGEAFILQFEVVDAEGAVIDLSSSNVSFRVKDEKSDTEYAIEKLDASFDKSEAAAGKVSVPITGADSALEPRRYYGEFRISFSPNSVFLSQDIEYLVTGPIYQG